MKTYIVTLIFLLAMQNSYCAQSEPLNLVDFYYVDSYQKRLDGDELIPVFLKQALQNRIDYKLSNVGWNTVAIKKWFHIMVCSILYTVKTPYIYPNPKDLEWFSKEYRKYFKFEDELYPSPNQLPQSLLFVEKPHCGDLAFCIRQTKNFDENDKLLQLLDASYEVQKLVRFADEKLTKMFHYTHFRNEILPLVDEFCSNTSTQYTLKNYQSIFKEIFLHATESYSVTILKNLILLFLMSNQSLHAYLQYSCYAIIGILICVDTIKLGPSIDCIVYGSHFITFCLIVAMYANMLNKNMYFYQKIVSICWITHASFFLTTLWYKYYKFKKVMDVL